MTFCADQVLYTSGRHGVRIYAVYEDQIHGVRFSDKKPLVWDKHGLNVDPELNICEVDIPWEHLDPSVKYIYCVNGNWFGSDLRPDVPGSGTLFIVNCIMQCKDVPSSAIFKRP